MPAPPRPPLPTRLEQCDETRSGGFQPPARGAAASRVSRSLRSRTAAGSRRYVPRKTALAALLCVTSAAAAPPPFLPPPAAPAAAAFAAVRERRPSADAPAAEWDAWAAALRDARDLAANAWIPVEPGRWLGPDEAGDELLRTAPPAARAAWVRVAAARAARLVDEANADPSDPRPPFTLARELLFTPPGRAAAGDLAAAAYRLGRVDEARRRWAALADSHPAGPLSPAAAADWAKVIAADLAAGRVDLAEWERTRFLAAFGPTEELETPFEASRWPPRLAPARTRGPGQNAARSGRLRGLPEPFTSEKALKIAEAGPSWTTPRVSEPDGPFPSAPAVWEGALLYNTGRRVVALNMNTGGPRWPVGPGDDGTLFPPPGVAVAPPVFLPNDRDPDPVGGARCGVAVHGRFAVARLGDPAVEWPPGDVRAPRSRLVCLDLEREGEAAWEVDAAVLSEPGEAAGTRWSWEGTPALGLDPLTGESRAFAVARRNRPAVRLDAVGLDLSTGALLWRTPLGAARSLPAPAVRTRSSISPTLCGGRLYIATGAGAVACVDAADGRPVWLSAYDRDPAAAASSWNAPAVAGGRAFVTPEDARGVRALDAATGELLWSRDLPGAGGRVLGVAGNRVIVARASLHGLDPATGETAWFRPPPDGIYRPADDDAAGLIGGAVAAWVAPSAVLLVDAASGAEVGAVPLAEVGVRAGALAGGPGAAVLAGPRAVVGWTGKAAVRAWPLANR